MAAKKHAQVYSHKDLGTDSRTMALYFGISLLFHLICLGAIIVVPEASFSRRLAPGAINVSLVTLPGPPVAGPAPKPQGNPIAPVKQEVKPVPKVPVVEAPPPKPAPEIKKPKKTVALEPPKKKKIKEKKSLKKKTQDRQKMIDHALTRVEKKVEKSETDSIQQALDRLKQEVAKTEAARSSPSSTVRGTTGAAASGASGGGSGGRRVLELIDIYKIEVAFQVERNWAFSQQLIGSGKNLQASLVFKVLPSGEITDIRFTERSGNSYLDESAHKAVVKANPVSPHPDAIRRSYVTVALRFTPEGIRK